MHRFNNIARPAVLATSVGLLLACSAETGNPSEPPPPISSGEPLVVSDSWVGHEVGLRAPIARDVRPIDDASPNRGEPDRASVRAANTDWVIFDGARGVRYRLDYDHEALSAVAEVMRARVMATAEHVPAREEDAELVKKAFDGVDSRWRLGIADGYPKEHVPFATIGEIRPTAGSHCTGTLISDNLVLTSAHCVLSKSYQLQTGTFDPRIDGTNSNIYLNPVSPWGSWRYDSAIVSNEFINRDCWNPAATGWPDNPTSHCHGADWAIVLVEKPANIAGHPGSMCFAWHGSKNTLNSYNLFTRGYPGCNGGGPPANCKSHTLYGDANDCLLGADVAFDQYGFPTATDFKCDISGGQSGSPIYLYNPSWVSGCGATVIGVESGYRPLNGAYINVMRRISPELSDFMILLASIF